MIAEERYAHILSEVERDGTVTVAQLAADLGISESTVRRDLEKLDAAHKLAKVHGGATRREDARVMRDLTISERVGLHADDKRRLAAAAAAMVGPDDFVYIDAGSTTRELVGCLEERGATYVTDSAPHAQALAARGLTVVLLGGELKAATGAVVGPDAIEALSRYHFTLGFWGANGIDAARGLTTSDREEAEVKRLSIEHTASGRRFVLTDPSKFGRVAPVRFAELADVTVLTTDVPVAYEGMVGIELVS